VTRDLPGPDLEPNPEAVAAEEAPYVDLVWEAQDLVNQGHTISTDDLRRTAGASARALSPAFRALDALQTALPSAAAPTLQPGDLLGGSEIRGIIGKGGMGIVYEAFDPEREEPVALKVLSPAMLGDTVALLRFKREAQVAEKLVHPNVVRVLGAGEERSILYLKMERVRGESLQAWLDRLSAGTLLPDEAQCRDWARRFQGLAGALHHAHQAGVIHRDVKPSNVLVDAERDGRLRLVDFGIARSWDTETLTATSAILGTPLYMAPEQAIGAPKSVGPPADVYGLGATLYETVTGQGLFDPDTGYAGLITKIVNEPPRAPRRLNPAVPRGLEVVLLKCLEKRPEARYGSAADLAQDLECVASGRAVKARPIGSIRRLGRRIRRQPLIAATLIGLIGTAALIAALVTRTPRSPYAEEASPSWIDLRQDAWIHLFASPDAPVLEEIDAKMAAWEPSTEDEAEEAKLLRAWIAHQRHDFPRALALLDAADGLRSKRAALLLRGSILRAAWRYDEAKAEEKKAEGVPLRSRLDHMLWALYLFRHKADREAGRKVADALEEACPDYLPARVLQAELAKASNDYKAALRACGTLLLMRPGNPTLLVLRGRVHQQAGKHKLALEDYRAAIKADPKYVEASCSLYYLLQRMGGSERREAEHVMAAGLQENPGSAWLLNARGWIRFLGGHYAEAATDFEAALRTDPYFALAQVNLGNALIKGGRDREALDVWQAMLDDRNQRPPNTAGILSDRAHYWWQKGRRERCFEDLRRALAVCYRPVTQANLSYYLIQEGRYGEAMHELDHLLSLVPDHKFARGRRARARLSTYDIAGAHADCEKAVKLWGRRTPPWVRRIRTDIACLRDGFAIQEERVQHALEGLKESALRQALLLQRAMILSGRRERWAEAEHQVEEFKNGWKRYPGDVDERPWADELLVELRGRRDGWAAAVKSWQSSGLAGQPGATWCGRFEPCRLMVAGARHEQDDAYRRLCRALLEDTNPSMADALAEITGIEEADRAWVVGRAWLALDRAVDALPHLERAARALGFGECHLDHALALARLGRLEEAADALQRALAGDLPRMHVVERLHEFRIPPDPVIRRPLLE